MQSLFHLSHSVLKQTVEAGRNKCKYLHTQTRIVCPVTACKEGPLISRAKYPDHGPWNLSIVGAVVAVGLHRRDCTYASHILSAEYRMRAENVIDRAKRILGTHKIRNVLCRNYILMAMSTTAPDPPQVPRHAERGFEPLGTIPQLVSQRCTPIANWWPQAQIANSGGIKRRTAKTPVADRVAPRVNTGAD